MCIEVQDKCTIISPLVSVIVPVHNGELTLRQCLEAILQSDYPDYEVIVVDDASSDGSVAIAQQFPCRLLNNGHNGGAADARNTGVRESLGEILFFTDSDVIIQRDTISKLVRYLLAHPECSAVFGSYTAETIPTNFFSEYKNLVHHFTHQMGCEEASTFWAGCGAMWAKAFLDAGGFDPTDTAGADVEDIALGYRLLREGHRIRLIKDVQVTHGKRYSFVGLLRSDVFHRAVPWTKLMIRQRIVRNDLNTKWENFLSTLVTFAMFASLLLGVLSLLYLVAIPGLLALFVYLNRKLFGFFLARNGVVFALQGVAMGILFYVYCAFGLAVGVLSVLFEGTPVARGVPVLNRGSRAVRVKRESVGLTVGEE